MKAKIYHLFVLKILFCISPLVYASDSQTYVDYRGCKLIETTENKSVELKVLHAVGTCIDGYYQGRTLYSFLQKNRAPNNIDVDLIVVKAGWTIQGRLAGPFLQVSQKLLVNNYDDRTLYLMDDRGQILEKKSTFDHAFSMDQLTDAIDKEVMRFGGQAPTSHRDFLTDLSYEWRRDYVEWFKKYSQQSNFKR